MCVCTVRCVFQYFIAPHGAHAHGLFWEKKKMLWISIFFFWIKNKRITQWDLLKRHTLTALWLWVNWLSERYLNKFFFFGLSVYGNTHSWCSSGKGREMYLAFFSELAACCAPAWKARREGPFMLQQQKNRSVVVMNRNLYAIVNTNRRFLGVGQLFVFSL